jgi:hypothetical protein
MQAEWYRSERGGVNVGTIVTLLLAFFFVYEAMQFGPLLMRQFQFQDAVMEAAKFSRGKDASSVQSEVLQKASELALPVSRDMIKVLRQPTNTRIQVRYELSAEWLPGKPYKWVVNIDEESVLF